MKGEYQVIRGPDLTGSLYDWNPGEESLIVPVISCLIINVKRRLFGGYEAHRAPKIKVLF